jgi:hypothetical protein
MQVDIRYTIRCSAQDCEATEVRNYAQMRCEYGMTLPIPEAPAGWVTLGTQIFCPTHHLLLAVDGGEPTVVLS